MASRRKVRPARLALPHMPHMPHMPPLAHSKFHAQPSLSHQNELLAFLSSSTVPSVGNYVLLKTIGEGTFGKVKLGRHKLTGQQVAVKIVDKIHAPALVREIETWRQMRHPNIAQLYEVLCTESKIYMVMEFCNGGEAFDYIVKHGRMDDNGSECRRIFWQIVDAVGQCHEKNFVHRDLKLENILLTETLNVKLIDFGFTRDYENSKLLDTYCGSSAYASPEIVSGKKYSGPEADIWSLGVILYTLLCGYLPFDEESEAVTHKKIVELDYELPGFLSDISKDFISKFLRVNPAERISITDALQHPWFNRAGPALPPPAIVVGSQGEDSLLSGSHEEMLLAAKLEALGFDVPTILESVHTNACDQACALWYLLLQRNRDLASNGDLHQTSRSSMLANTTTISSEVTPSHLPAAASGSDTELSHSSGIVTPKEGITNSIPATLALNVDIEKYFAQARRKSTGPGENPLLTLASTTASGVVSSTPSSLLSMQPTQLGGGPSTVIRGRRSVMMDVMRTNTGSSGNQASTTTSDLGRPKSASHRYVMGGVNGASQLGATGSPKRTRPVSGSLSSVGSAPFQTTTTTDAATGGADLTGTSKGLGNAAGSGGTTAVASTRANYISTVCMPGPKGIAEESEPEESPIESTSRFQLK